ncbi:MAG: hypothetical protein FWE67_11805 [Planctomycetaceae bacterium]|nr:hypothetical protein [Planctomycetaceae bacterium]
MSQVVQLDATTILIKSDNEDVLAEIIDFVSAKDKHESVRSFLNFTSNNKILGENYQFNREECYDRQGVH